jgi:hypothetical protein
VQRVLVQLKEPALEQELRKTWVVEVEVEVVEVVEGGQV